MGRCFTTTGGQDDSSLPTRPPNPVLGKFPPPELGDRLGMRSAGAANLAGLATRASLPVLLWSLACDSPAPGPSRPRPLGISEEVAALRLAKVGDREILALDFAEALERMGELERLRYQTDDRRRELLEEMINVELLAQAAIERGLDRDPATVAIVRQLLKTEAWRSVDAALPQPAEIGPAELEQYYASHRGDFFDRERRRIAAVRSEDRARLTGLLGEVRGGVGGQRWNELVASVTPGSATSDRGNDALSTVAGDLGMVEAGPGETGNPEVGPAVRDAVFELGEVGGVVPRLVEEGGSYWVVRLVSIVPERQRTLDEVRSAVALRVVAARREEALGVLLGDLRRRMPVTFDREALDRLGLHVPEEER